MVPPEAPYPEVYTDTFIFFSDHCVKLYGSMCITFQMPLVQLESTLIHLQRSVIELHM